MIPKMTHTQFLIIDVMGPERAGKEIRAKLADEGVKMSLPAFYQLMARMEKKKWVKGWYVQKEIDGYKVKERRYKPLGLGAKVYRQTFEFYRQREIQGVFKRGLQPGEA